MHCAASHTAAPCCSTTCLLLHPCCRQQYHIGSQTKASPQGSQPCAAPQHSTTCCAPPAASICGGMLPGAPCNAGGGHRRWCCTPAPHAVLIRQQGSCISPTMHTPLCGTHSCCCCCTLSGSPARCLVVAPVQFPLGVVEGELHVMPSCCCHPGSPASIRPAIALSLPATLPRHTPCQHSHTHNHVSTSQDSHCPQHHTHAAGRHSAGNLHQLLPQSDAPSCPMHQHQGITVMALPRPINTQFAASTVTAAAPVLLTSGKRASNHQVLHCCRSHLHSCICI